MGSAVGVMSPEDDDDLKNKLHMMHTKSIAIWNTTIRTILDLPNLIVIPIVDVVVGGYI